MFISILTQVLGFLGGGALKSIMRHLDKKAELANDVKRLETEVVKKAIDAELELRKVNAEIVKVEQGWWLTALIRPMFALPFIFYVWFAAIDVIFDMGWNLRPLPASVMEWGGWIVGAYFLSRPLEKAWRGYMHRRK